MMKDVVLNTVVISDNYVQSPALGSAPQLQQSYHREPNYPYFDPYREMVYYDPSGRIHLRLA